MKIICPHSASMKVINMIIKKIKEKLTDIFLFEIGPFLRKFKKKPLPCFEKVLIHIGCGSFNDKRYINIDSRQGWHIDYTEKVENIASIFNENYADLIYACHVLEHVSHLKTLDVLKNLRKVLKKEGILRLSVPDFDTIVNMYKEKKAVKDIIPPLMGGQGYEGNFHFAVFNEEYLKKLLLEAGFSQVRPWLPKKADFHDFDDWSCRKINMYNKNWEISLNMEAVK